MAVVWIGWDTVCYQNMVKTSTDVILVGHCVRTNASYDDNRDGTNLVKLTGIMNQLPNIVVITCHDLGRHMHCYGVPTVHTPNLDGLAAAGVRFGNSFCVAPQCSPSRAALFTGRYPHSNGMMGLAHGAFAWDLHADERHLAGFLAEAGWHTVLLAHQHETRRPRAMGYDQVIDIDKVRPCTATAQRAVAWLDTQRATTTPFFLQMGFFEPHRPFEVFDTPPDGSLGLTIPPYLVDEPSAREEFAGYQGAIRKLDEAIGQFLAALDQKGLADDTLVLFTSDHGIPFPRAKCSLYDPGLEVPLVLRWPRGPWRSGTTLDPLVPNVDVLPTLLDLAGIEVPANVQGQSFAPLLLGESYEARDAIYGQMTYHDYCDPRRCIRTSTHKLIVNFTNARFFMDPSQMWRPKTTTVDPANPAAAYHETVELYDLASDPLETKNLARSTAHLDVCHRLLTSLHQWMRQTSDPLLDGIPSAPIFHRAASALSSGRVPDDPDPSHD